MSLDHYLERNRNTGVVATLVGIPLAVAALAFLAHVKCEARKARRDQGASTQLVAYVPPPLSTERIRGEISRAERSSPPIAEQVAAYVGPLPAYAPGPRMEGGNNAKIFHRIVRRMIALERTLSPDQIRRLRLTLMAFGNRYGDLSYTTMRTVVGRLDAELRRFLSDEQVRGFHVATEFDATVAVSLGLVRAPDEVR